MSNLKLVSLNFHVMVRGCMYMFTTYSRCLLLTIVFERGNDNKRVLYTTFQQPRTGQTTVKEEPKSLIFSYHYF